MRVRAAMALVVCVVLGSCSSAKQTAPTVGPNGEIGKSSSTPSPSATPAPASPFEDDPAVKALRAWAAQAGKTVNGGKFEDAALDALMTPDFAKTMQRALGTEVGHYYPGPLPFTPIAVTKSTVAMHEISICMVSDGFSLDPATHRPAATYHVGASTAGAELVNGKWLVSKLDAGSFSCDGVKVPQPGWATS